MTECRIVVEGGPAPWSVWTRQGPRSPSRVKMEAYQALIQVAAINQVGKPMLEGRVMLSLIFLRAIPKSAPKNITKRQEWCRRHMVKRPDLTNYLKACEDALQGLLFEDDSQVVSCTASKGYDWNGDGRTIIVATPMDE